MGVHISVDAFTSDQDHFLPRIWSMKDNAFGYSWSEEVLFLHPPYGLLDKVVDKIFEDQCFGLLICPVESGAR